MAQDRKAEEERAESAREMFQILREIANLLDTSLDDRSLTYCIRLCESGVNPEVLARQVVSMQAMAGLEREEK